VKNMSFNIGKLEEFPQGSIKEVSIQGRTYAIFNINGKLFAIDGRCTHAGGKLSHGHLVGKIVTCPKHGAQFDVTTGKNLKKPRIPFAKASDLKSYKVTIKDENVVLDEI
jgi:nitrite reductase/ring-hydroxylating ferredoxin subunit